jgi:hypothetical protein
MRRKEKDFLAMIDEIFLLQRMNGKHVVVESPTTSDLWQQPEIRRWRDDECTHKFSFDMCSYGLKSAGKPQKLLRKSMTLLSTHVKFQEVLGQRDPDLGNIEVSVDAPTANRHSVLLGLQVALARRWMVAIGDIQAAFLNGVEAPWKLFSQ